MQIALTSSFRSDLHSKATWEKDPKATTLFDVISKRKYGGPPSLPHTGSDINDDSKKSNLDPAQPTEPRHHHTLAQTFHSSRKDRRTLPISLLVQKWYRFLVRRRTFRQPVQHRRRNTTKRQPLWISLGQEDTRKQPNQRKQIQSSAHPLPSQPCLRKTPLNSRVNIQNRAVCCLADDGGPLLRAGGKERTSDALSLCLCWCMWNATRLPPTRRVMSDEPKRIWWERSSLVMPCYYATAC